jgi:hypothetical protein
MRARRKDHSKTAALEQKFGQEARLPPAAAHCPDASDFYKSVPGQADTPWATSLRKRILSTKYNEIARRYIFKNEPQRRGAIPRALNFLLLMDVPGYLNASQLSGQ